MVIVEIDRNGSILGQAELPGKIHSQPEGIVFAPDMSMIIANDGQGGRGTLVVHSVKLNE